LIETQSPDDIGAINDLCHDLLFAISGITFDRAAGILEVPLEHCDVSEAAVKTWCFGLVQRFAVQPRLRILRFSKVTDFRVVDEAEVDAGCFNVLTWAAGCITVTSSLPVTLTIETSGFGVAVIQTDIAVGAVSKGWRLGILEGWGR
jgi:hypothetical protein